MAPNTAALRLGVHKDWQRPVWTPHDGAVTYTAPNAFSRIISSPRVAGHNDLIGDCVPTMACNAIQGFLSRQGNDTPISDDVAVQVYSAVTGYVPGDSFTDQGTNPDQFFAWWKQNPIAGHKLVSNTAVNFADEAAIKHAIAAFYGVSLVLDLAVEQQEETIWTANGTPGTWGGHSIWADQYDGLCGCTSWGAEKLIDWSLFSKGFVIGAWILEIESAM